MKAVGIINDSLYDFVSGKTLFFSLQDFEQKIVKEARCFICGADRTEKEFNEDPGLCCFAGMGIAKSSSVMAAMELGRRLGRC